ncbi:MAG: sn-glycerol-3-phosphate ABC transporter ATP-binding protein UgpC [Gemmatimonadota bacterium]|nr:MAG: sn-glycerol-3-phosphate ABC transporter ATP-binding protein UgpC [Gemmatimonadota bacterium]
MAHVLLKNVYKIFDNQVVAAKDVTLEVKDREFMVWVGPSGCGKSTILRLIAGLESLSRGEIYIDNVLINHIPPKDRDIAMVFQNYALYPHMTVYQNLAFALKLRKRSKTEIDRRVREAADILGIGDLLHRKPKALSGGERQRVAVGRAIVRQPKVFLFDEPLSNLDAKLRVQMRAEISKLHSRLEATMIYVTHDQVEAMTMGERIAVIQDGIVQQIEIPLNLYNSPANLFVAGFIGSPPMNVFQGSIENNTFVGKDIRVSMPQTFQGKLERTTEVVLGIRPEDIHDISAEPRLSERSIVRATAEVIELMGNEIFLYLRKGDTPFMTRVSPQTQISMGETIDVIFDLSKLHLFDRETGNRI